MHNGELVLDVFGSLRLFLVVFNLVSSCCFRSLQIGSLSSNLGSYFLPLVSQVNSIVSVPFKLFLVVSVCFYIVYSCLNYLKTH